MKRPEQARPWREEVGQWLPLERGNGVVTAKQNKASFWGDQNVLKLTMLINAQLDEHTESHQTVHFQCVNCMARELYLKKVVQNVSDRSSGRLNSEHGPEVRAAAVAAAVWKAPRARQSLGRQAHWPLC